MGSFFEINPKILKSLADFVDGVIEIHIRNVRMALRMNAAHSEILSSY
ncbi:MAG: hypothetical protein PHD13_05595 [Methanocellales archaeon]|nr:hypothetical protein [Methanocellales archaeon]MDD3291970.1 hypothetical protein [Methanocellales archaeon]MDD5235628.1 hypothetical protein [Methanocellales archaeon]MDD5485475.1 hypothetical protein [Methanocellales archaeon]